MSLVRNRKLFASIMMIVATLIWGLMYSIQSISADNLGTYAIVFCKGLGGVFLFPLIFFYKQKFNKYSFFGGLVIGLSSFVGCVFQQRGLVLSSVSKASFITVLYIVIVPIIGLLLGKKIKLRMVFSILITVVGLYFLCINESFNLNIGDLYLLVCATLFALQIILIDYFVRKSDALPLSLVSQSTTAFLSAIFMIIFEKPSINDFMNALWPVLYMIFITGSIAGTIQTVYQKDLEPSFASLLMSFESVFGALFGWLILKQGLSLKEIVGCFLVFVGILFAK